jgi:2-amino-4-hydroxy-6-hydroxymethyldihydropteridine diphosphokinase
LPEFRIWLISALVLGFRNPYQYLSVFICGFILSMSASARIYLSLGSNLGDRSANLEQAIEALPGAGIKILRRSSTYETEPVDFLEQPWFLNCVMEGKTNLPPRALLGKLQGIEQQLGSRKLVPRGPRIIDLDVLFYGSQVIREPGIEIPHPRLAQRRFVLVPLVEIAPQLRHPLMGKTADELLAETPDRSVVRIWRALGAEN